MIDVGNNGDVTNIGSTHGVTRYLTPGDHTGGTKYLTIQKR
jgi:hypothetical protein